MIFDNELFNNSEVPELRIDVHQSEQDNLMSELSQKGTGAAETDVNSLDKEMLRKIKRKERNKLNRKRKKALQRNLSHMATSDLQMSVAALATTVGGGQTSLVNDPIKYFEHSQERNQNLENVVGNDPPINDDSSKNVDSDELNTFMNVSNKLSKPNVEVPICILDSDNFNARLSGIDMQCVNEYLEQCIYKDLTITPKIKISNTYISTERRLWVICHSYFTSSWVIRKIAGMPAMNGRKLSAHTLTELEVMTMVSILVPKECSNVETFDDLMRLLILQNPSLGKGTTLPEVQKGPMRRILEETIHEDEDITDELTDALDVKDVASDNSAAAAALNVDSTTLSSTVSNISGASQADKTIVLGLTSGVERPESSRSSRNRSFSVYADDTWLNELRQLGYRPYLGVRRLLCVMGPRHVQKRSSNTFSGGSAQHKRRKRHGTGRRNFRGTFATPADAPTDCNGDGTSEVKVVSGAATGPTELASV